MAIALLQPLRSLLLTGVKRWIRRKFPHVNQLSTEELASWLADGDRIQPILLDARSAAEYEVSHLKDAHLAEPRVEALQQQLQSLSASPDSSPPIVVYCSVGYRSSALAQTLQQLGYLSVFNLEGSLFQWVNEGKPVYRGDRPTTRVHPYSATWKLLLFP